MGPNHPEWCDGKVFRYSGSGYNRVKICACGAEDHAPELCEDVNNLFERIVDDLSHIDIVTHNEGE